MENYKKNHHGVIQQIEYTKTVYDQKYVDVRYNNYGELTNYMSHLRLGYIIGSIGKIPNSILDVGYGNGSFLETSSSAIPNCFGYDVSGVQLSEKIKIVDNLFSQHYEVITFFDSLEHCEDIYFLDKLNCDYLCISVPWCHNFSDEWFESWKHRRPNEHLHHFDQQSLKNFVESQGFVIVNSTNIEDSIRKTNHPHQNILTSIFKKLK
jgi:hypothetical protein